MAMLFMDGFDKYGPPGQITPTVTSLLTAGEWTSASSNYSIVAGLSGSGNALQLQGTSIGPSRSLGGNLPRLIGGVRFSISAFTGTNFVQFLDGATAQCSITVNTSTATISLRTGTYSGAIIATSAGSISVNSTHYLEWDITFAAAGAYQVWLDGASIMSGTGNTKSSANSYANIFSIMAASVGNPSIWDDLYLFDNTGATCNAPLLNNPIVETALPNADVQKQWTASATIIGNDNSANAAANAPGANQLFLRQFTAPVSMTLNSLSCVPQVTNGAAKFKPVIYGTPGSVGAIGGHRYWRVNVLANSGGGNLQVAEFQFRTTAGTPLLFSGGTASAAAFALGPASNATDNNPATTWNPNAGNPLWWQYDYGAGVTPAIVEITVTNQAVASGNPSNFDVQYSDDGVNYFTVANYTATWAFGGQTQTFTFSARANTAGSPGSVLIALGNEVIGTINNVTLTATFPTPPSLTGGAQYAIGFITDTSVSLAEQDTAATGIRVVNTYINGAPATLPTPTSGLASWQIWGNCTGASVNYASLINNPAIDDIANVTSSTVGQEDLYSFPVLSNNPASIACVAYKARTKRSDAGARTVEVHCASGSADSAGSLGAVAPGSSFGWLDTYFPLDPNTGVAWSGSAVNAASAGPKVAS